MKIISNTLFIITLLMTTNLAAKNQDKMKQLSIQKSIEIKASLNTVFEHIAYLKNFPKWSPFLEADPDQKYEVKGTDGQVGAQYHWEGNKGKDLGYQEIKAIIPSKSVLMQCDIQKPFTAQPTFNYQLKQKGENVVVTQDFELPIKGMNLFFMKLFGAVKDINKMNERGLALLKIACEQA